MGAGGRGGASMGGGPLKPVRLEELEQGAPQGAPQKEQHAFVRVFAYIKPHRTMFWLGSIFSVINIVFDLMPPLLTKWMIDSAQGNPPDFAGAFVDPENKHELAGFLAVLTFIIFFFESLFEYLYKKEFQVLAQKVQHDLRLALWGRIASREAAFFEGGHRTGDTLAVMNDDVNMLERSLSTTWNELLFVACTVVIAASAMLYINVQLALISMSAMPFVFYGSLWYHRTIAPRYTRVRNAAGEMLSRLENNVAGIAVIKAFNAHAAEAERVRAASAEYLSANEHAIAFSAAYVPCIRMLIAVSYSAVIYQATVWAIDGRLTLGDLALYSMATQRLLWPITRLGQTVDEVERASASARRAFALLDRPSAIRDPEPGTEEHLPKAGAGRGREVRLEGVDFGYGGGREPVMRGLDLTIEAGTFVGVAGATGAGKTTLTKLVMRSYDPNGGAVRLDGVDLRRLPLHELREQISLVSQDGYVFSGTLRENIAYGERDDATLDEVRAAARAAHFDEFVMSLPDRYETLVGERGVRLSGGQRQRLSIARAMLKGSSLLLLDEATASVDSKTERMIQANLGRLIRGRTSIVIAHRLSTIRHADRIIVLDNGRVAEDGTHEELLALGGRYHELWSTQTGEVAADDDGAGAAVAV